MAASTMYKGKNLRIKLDDEIILHATDCSFSSDMEIEKIATKDTNGNLKITGSYDWNLSSSGVVSNKPSGGTQQDYLALITKHKAGTSCSIEFTNGNAGDVIISGDGFIKSFSVKAPEKGFATMDVSIEGSGDYTAALIP